MGMGNKAYQARAVTCRDDGWRRRRSEAMPRPGPIQMSSAYLFLRVWMTSRIDSDRGANLVEYALLLLLIAVACLAAVTALGSTTSQKYSEIESSIG